MAPVTARGHNLMSVVRILDLDLDFFVRRTAHFKASDSERLGAEEYPPWRHEEAIEFLEERCKLSAKLPGFVVEHHGELFGRWRDAIESGKLQPTFEVTHVDAHADLGMGDNGYMYLMTELLFAPAKERRFPRTDVGGLGDGNWLTFAIACRWVSELIYVLNTAGPPSDLILSVMEGFDKEAAHVQLAAMQKAEVDKIWEATGTAPLVERLEPKVRFRWVPYTAFEASAPYDVICLSRSPGFTPVESDALFEEIRERFVDETAFA